MTIVALEKIKLSHLIRQGKSLAKPTYDAYIETIIDEDDNEVIAACPLGMAVLAASRQSVVNLLYIGDNEVSDILENYLGYRIDDAYPEISPTEIGEIRNLRDTITSLTDSDGWTPDEIIGWLESIGR